MKTQYRNNLGKKIHGTKKYIAIGTMLILMSTMLIGCGVRDDINPLNVNDKQANEDVSKDGVTNEVSGEATANNESTDSSVVADTSTGTTTEPTTNTTSDTTEEQPESSTDGPVLLLPEPLPDGLGGLVDFNNYKGKMLFVNFFGTWCTYCMQEMPDFQKFTDNYSDSASIVIVNALETENIDMQGVVDWYNENGYTMQLAFDVDKTKTGEYYGAIQGFPTTFVFDGDQNFLGYIPGMMDYTLLEQIMTDYAK